MSLLWTSILGLKKQVSHVPREVTCVHLLPATSILRFCSTCLLQEQTNPGVYYGYVSECDRARSIAQPFFKTPLVSHFLILAKAKHIASPRVRMECPTKLHGRGHGFREGEELEPFLKSITCTHTMSKQYRFLTLSSPPPHFMTHRKLYLWHTRAAPGQKRPWLSKDQEISI